MNMLRANQKCIMGKNPIQTTTITIYIQSHYIIKGNVMHKHVITYQQNPSQKISQKLKDPKNFPKT